MTDQRTGVRVLRCIAAAMAIALPCAYADRAGTSFETHIRTGDSALERVTRERLSGKARADALREAAQSEGQTVSVKRKCGSAIWRFRFTAGYSDRSPSSTTGEPGKATMWSA